MARKRHCTPLPLPEAELELLACLQELGRAEAAELRRRLEPQRPLTHASVVTLLGRLRTRGLVDRRKAQSGKAFVYFPTPAAAGTSQRLLGRLLKRVFHDSTVSMVATLLGAKPPTQQELEELRDMLDALEKEKTNSREAR